MQYPIKYGAGSLCVDLPDTQSVTVVTPRHVPPLRDPVAAFAAALDAPMGCPRLEEMAVPATVAIAVPDETTFPQNFCCPRCWRGFFGLFPSCRTSMCALW